MLFLVNQTAPTVGIEKAVKTRALSSVEVTHIEPGRPPPLNISPRSVVKCSHNLGIVPRLPACLEASCLNFNFGLEQRGVLLRMLPTNKGNEPNKSPWSSGVSHW